MARDVHGRPSARGDDRAGPAKLRACGLLAGLVSVLCFARPAPAEAASPFLVVPDPAVAEESPAYRYANMTNEEALAELDRRQILYSREAPVGGVREPIRLTGRLHGVYFHSSLPPDERVTSMFEILDARLALAIDDFAAVLERHDIDEVVHFTMYRPNVGKPDDADHDADQAAVRRRRGPSSSPAASRSEPAGSSVEPGRKSAVAAKPAAVLAPTKPAAVAAPTKPAAVAAPTKPAAVAAPTKPAAVAATQKPAAVAATQKPAAVAATQKPAAVAATQKPAAVAVAPQGKAPAAKGHDKLAREPKKDRDEPHAAGSKHKAEQPVAKPTVVLTSAHAGQAAKPASAGPAKPSPRSAKRHDAPIARRESAPVRPSPVLEPRPAAPSKPPGLWAPPGTRHPAGLAIDVGALHKRDGGWLSVAGQFQGHIGDKTCGSDVRVPDSAEARELRSLVCESSDLGIFTYVLTPNFNVAHVDHFHMEIKPGVRWFLYH